MIYQAVQQAVHVSFTTRQSRKGEISSWKAYAPAHAGKLAVEAVDRVMRGEGAPSPIYEGEDSVIAWLLDGPNALYHVPLPAAGEPKRAILDSYTKEHSAEYQSQALIDLAFRMRGQIPDLGEDREGHHPHQPSHARRDRHRRQRPAEDGSEGEPRDAGPFDHVHLRRRTAGRRAGITWTATRRSRAGRADTVRLWHKIETREDPEWTRRYRSTDPTEQAFGGRVEVLLRDGTASWTRWRWRTRIRWGRNRSAATTTSASSGR